MLARHEKPSGAVWLLPGGGVRFSVKVNGALVYDRTLDAKRNPDDRGWFPGSVDLGPWSGRPVDLVFRTEPAAGGDPSHCTAGWVRPHLAPG